MGAYLTYKVDDVSLSNEVVDFLIDSKINKKLGDYAIWINCHEDIENAKKENDSYWIDFLTKYVGTGNIKTSGLEGDEEELEKLASMWTELFCQLNDRFPMKYWAGSCSLR